MTIRDIAKLANVSVSTVSKIMNNKEAGISDETRQKVLQIIKEYQFVPYAKVREKMGAPTNTIGIILPEITGIFSGLVKIVQHTAESMGYGLLLCTTDYNLEEERKHFQIFLSQKVDGIVFVPSHSDNIDMLQPSATDIPLAVIDFYQTKLDNTFYCFDYTHAADKGTEYLVKKGHNRIGLILNHQRPSISHCLLEGYKNALKNVRIPFDDSIVFSTEQEISENMRLIDESGIQAVFCQDMAMASTVYKFAYDKHLNIPRDISVISLEDLDSPEKMIPALTTMRYPVEEIAETCTVDLIHSIQKQKKERKISTFKLELIQRQSVKKPACNNGSKIVVMGTLNMDTVLRVPHIPSIGETLMVTAKTSWPGGKGANQALGISKLGGNSFLIGKLGNDRNGKEVYENLVAGGVNVQGVTFENAFHTGTAYIYVTPEGDNAITVFSGANTQLNAEYFKKCESVFDKVKYCVVQTEISLDATREVVTYCHRKNIKVILKPAPVGGLERDMLEGLYLLVPNEMELQQLVPGGQNLKEKAKILLKYGLQNIIVTLGAHGCFYMGAQKEMNFDAADFTCVDATGASDAFISALVVFLAEGYSMAKSIEIATIAAGISVTREGVQAALADRNLLNLYCNGLL